MQPMEDDDARSNNGSEAEVSPNWLLVRKQGGPTVHRTGVTRCRFSAYGHFWGSWHYVAEGDVDPDWHVCQKCYPDGTICYEKSVDVAPADSDSESGGSRDSSVGSSE